MRAGARRPISPNIRPAEQTAAFGPIGNADEIMFRQVDPILYAAGAVASSAFMPTEDDQDHMSVDRGSLTNPKASFDLYRENGRQSAAVYGVSVGEFTAEGIPCQPDPLPATENLKANPAHAYADYNGIGSNQRRKKAQRPRTAAPRRGLLHPLA
jgi:hypothetical protein